MILSGIHYLLDKASLKTVKAVAPPRGQSPPAPPPPPPKIVSVILGNSYQADIFSTVFVFFYQYGFN